MDLRSTIAILFAASLFGTQTAAADPADGDVRQRAAAAFDQGVSRFRRGDAGGALAAFEEAFRLVPDPAILYNLGQTELALEHEARAYQSLERYLAESGEAVSRARRAEVTRTLERLRPRIGAVVLTVRPRGAELSVDEGAPEPLPLGGVVYLDPGPHRLVLHARGHRSVERSVDTVANAEERLDVTLEREPGERTSEPSPRPEGPDGQDGHDEPSRPTPDGGRGVPFATFAFGTAAVSAFALAAVTGAMALSRQSEVDDARAAWRRGESVDRVAIEDQARSGQTLALVTDVALVVGVVAAGASVFFLLRRDGEPAPAVSQAAIAPIDGGLVVAIGGALP